MIWILLVALFSNSIKESFMTFNPDSTNSHQPFSYLTLNHHVKNIVEHKAFKGFGELLLPWDNNAAYLNTSFRDVGSLMPYHGNVNPDVVLASVNHMIKLAGENKKIFYPFYSDLQIRQDPSLRQTGLFFFPGKRGAPFAIVCPGGGFSYVGSLHEGFPIAQEVSKNDLNAFVIRYRNGNEQNATKDLAAAITYIFSNPEIFGVSLKNYSLWGGSAGARMVGNIALSGVIAYGGGTIPKPSTLVIAYTGQSTYSPDFPPTFITVASNDRIANVGIVEQRVKNLISAGVAVEFRKFNTAGHGFGTGKGTDAEGWLRFAIGFWQKHSKT